MTQSPHADARQLESFQKNGFLLVPALFDAEEMQLLQDIAKADMLLANDAMLRKDATGGSSRLTVRNELDDETIYAAIVRCRRVAGTMETLLGDEVYHYHHKMMLKDPRVGGAWEWHQDYGYWYDNGCLYPDMASCLIAVDRATRENGCLQVLRGSHHLGRIEHTKLGNQTTGNQTGADLARVQAAVERHELVYCEMKPGDALFFHSNLLHRSDQNTSDHSRWSLICCYNTRHNDPIIRDGRHPNYTYLEKWPDERVKEIGRRQLETLKV